MNINNLKVGMVIKNYKELCKVLEIKATSGEAKQNQLKQLAEVVKYHKEGNKFIIDGIDDTKVVGEVLQKKMYYNNNTNIKTFLEKKTDNFYTDLDIPIEEYDDYKNAEWNLMALADYIEHNSNYIPSFSVLCRILEIKYTKNSNTRDNIIDYLGNFFEIEKCKKGRGYMVTKTISTNYIPMIKQGKYDKVITDIFLDYLIKNNVTNECLYKNDIFCILDFCSADFKEYINKQSEVAKEMNLDKLQVEDYFNVAFQRMNTIMTKALNNMYRQGLLSGFEVSYMLTTMEEEFEEEINYRQATDEERDWIQYCIAKALVEFENPIVETKEIKEKQKKGFGYTGKTRIIEVRKYRRYTINDIPKYRLEAFNSYVLAQVQKKFPHILKYYSCHAIRFNEYTCNWYLESNRLNPNSKKSNDLICSALLKTFQNNHNKAVNGKTVKRYQKYEEVRLYLEGYIDLVERFNRLDLL